MGSDLRLWFFRLVIKLPGNRLTAPLKKRVEIAVDTELTAVKQESLQKYWENVRLHRDIGRALAEENLPEKKAEGTEGDGQEGARADR